MELGEKLQQLRKTRGMTQEELAEALFVSRTAISKWESGRGYPSIDSLKALSSFFSVSVDDLLSAEKLMDIAEKDAESRMRRVSGRLFGAVDLSAFLLIFLPLYPNPADGYVDSVNLLAFTNVSPAIRGVYWALFLALILAGAVKIVLTEVKAEKGQRAVTTFSMGVGILCVFLLALTKEAYAVVVAFLLLIGKTMLFFPKR